VSPPEGEALVPTHCDLCKRSAQVDYVTLEQNIGLLVFRIPKRLRGYLCRTCSAHVFWRMTLVTFFLGWWGVISFFVTFVVLYRNVATFVRTRALLPPA
jgi:hypothetical protein